MPPPSTLLCDRCRLVLPDALLNAPAPVPCPGCQALLLTRVFPAFRRPPPAAQTAESVVSDEDASCFYHPRKKAVVPCGQCGRFLCALCDLDLDGRHFCPGCVEAGRTVSGKAALQAGLPPQQRTLYDKVALSLALLPLLLWPFTLLTAPAALFFSIRYWHEPTRGPMPRGRWRMVLAGLLALLQITGWAVLFYFQFVHASLFTSRGADLH